MNPRIAYALPVLAIIVIAVAAFSLTRPSAADPSLNQQEQELLELLNDYRVENGVQPLVVSDALNSAADWFATDMATQNYYGGHTDSLGRGPGARGAAFGYPWGVGENSGAGFPTAQSMFEAWKASTGHNRNMLRSFYRMVGVGMASSPSSYYGTYWVLDLGTVLAEPVPTPTPPPTPSPTPTPSPSPTPTPSPTPVPTPPPITGDANCDMAVGADDVITVLRGEVGHTAPECIDNANVNCDDAIDSRDALAILLWMVNQPLSVDSDCSAIGLPL